MIMLKMKLEKETKGTYIYVEVPKEGESEDTFMPAVPSLYVRKWKLGGSPPRFMTLTLVDSAEEM